MAEQIEAALVPGPAFAPWGRPTPAQGLRLFVVGPHQADQVGLLLMPHAQILIGDTEGADPLPLWSPWCRGALSLRFEDGEPIRVRGLCNAWNARCMSYRQAQAVWRFVDRHKRHIAAIVVHSATGLGRSLGLAAALCRATGGDDRVFLHGQQANMHVYRLVLRAAGERASQDAWTGPLFCPVIPDEQLQDPWVK